MSLDLQLQVLWSNPKLLVAGAVVLAVAAQTLYEKRKRAQRAEPQWSHSMGGVCVGNRGRSRHVFQSRTVRSVPIKKLVVVWLTCFQEEIRRRVRDEGVLEGRYVCRITIGAFIFPKPCVDVQCSHKSCLSIVQLISEIYRNAQVRPRG